MALDRVRDQPSGIAVVAHVARARRPDSSRPPVTTAAPSRASRSAAARPIPSVPPTTRATLPSNRHGTSGGSVTSTKRGR